MFHLNLHRSWWFDRLILLILIFLIDQLNFSLINNFYFIGHFKQDKGKKHFRMFMSQPKLIASRVFIVLNQWWHQLLGSCYVVLLTPAPALFPGFSSLFGTLTVKSLRVLVTEELILKQEPQWRRQVRRCFFSELNCSTHSCTCSLKPITSVYKTESLSSKNWRQSSTGTLGQLVWGFPVDTKIWICSCLLCKMSYFHIIYIHCPVYFISRLLIIPDIV